MFTRKTIFPALLLFCSTALFALNSPRLEPGVGYFGEGLSACARGDTIVYVYLNTDATGDVAGSQVKYCISLDGGASWQEHILQSSIPHRIEPTLSPWGDGWLVNAGEFYLDEDGSGAIVPWSLIGPWGFNIQRSEYSPYFFDRNGVLTEFGLQPAYPEWEQYGFTINGTEDIRFKPYSYYTEHDSSPNNTNVYWYGHDVVDGMVISNGDLWIKSSGGGNNGGWPTFLAPVLVGGHVISTPGGYPQEQVFQGGLWEEIEMPSLPKHNPARETGIHLDALNPGSDIYLIEVDGSSYTGWHGVITEPYRVHATVYGEYPPAADSLFTNTFSISDTLWAPIAGGVCADEEFFVDGELWIKGDFQGRQSWTCSGDLKIIGDITLSGTIPGENPSANTTDVVNLLSERNIEIKYGYRNPADSLRIHPMCGPDDEPHYIYANLYAIGDGPREGVFTFEYQHPHPSTPALDVQIQNDDGTLETVTFDWIDLHRRGYPPTASQPWPTPGLGQQLLDLPWYNPLWPEAQPYLERGTLEIWGSLYQRRRGFIHRSHNDSEYPSNSGVWNVEMDMCGYPTNPINIPDPVFGNIGLQSRNYPGAPGSGVGYKKNYHTDPRWEFCTDPDDFYTRCWGHGIRISALHDVSYQFETFATAGFNEAIQSKSMDARNGVFAYAANDVLLFDDGGENQINLCELTQDQGLILNVQISPDQKPVIHQYRRLDSGEGFTVITEIDPVSPAQILSSYSYPSHPQQMPEAFCITPNGRRMLVRFDNGALYLSEILPDGTLEDIDSVNISDTMYMHGRLSMKAASDFALDLFYWENISGLQYDGWGKIHHFRLQVPVSNDDPGIPAITHVHLNAYPNPANHSLNIDMKIPAHQQHSLEIFNIRGQKIREYAALGSKFNGDYKLEWDLKDERRNPVSRGIYIIRLKVDGKDALSKRITIN